MNDRMLIENIASMWIAYGGDSEGFSFLQKQIHDRIKEIEQIREQ